MLVSSKDVAKHAGVSQTTVSRVLNTPDQVKKDTYEKVMQAIDELNYIPNAQARSLVQQSTRTIALLSGPLHNPFFADTTSAIVNYANEVGYHVNVQFVSDDEIREAYDAVLTHRVDGILLSCILIDDPIYDKLVRLDIPFITYNRKHRKSKNFVEIDNFEAGYLAAKHLIELGHRDIAWIGGSQSVSTFNHRYKGFQKAFEDFNVPLDERQIFHVDTSKQSIYNTFMKAMEETDRPTAICAGSDSIALFLIDRAIKENLHVPDDVSVIGIDNVDMSSHGLVQLTTVGSISERNLGLVAIKNLIELIENKNKGWTKVTESVKVFTRNTTKQIK